MKMNTRKSPLFQEKSRSEQRKLLLFFAVHNERKQRETFSKGQNEKCKNMGVRYRYRDIDIGYGGVEGWGGGLAVTARLHVMEVSLEDASTRLVLETTFASSFVSGCIRIDFDWDAIPVVHATSVRIPLRPRVFRLNIPSSVACLTADFKFDGLTFLKLSTHLVGEFNVFFKEHPTPLRLAPLVHFLFQHLSSCEGFATIDGDINSVDAMTSASPCKTFHTDSFLILT
mmetsp:Transcript_30509/g.35992  ORF Transcript_30509/g.35992 Transcript_30509/m.35992 type:complete len:228 (-) Transcript_30509:1359-2042(-)